jgi:hypothetical protein
MNRSTHQRVSIKIALLLSVSVFAALLLGSASAAAQLPFFPGAEGFGGAFTGGAPSAGWFSNATVYHVTNLDDSGPGSLRAAFVQNSSNKIIVFDVGGTIELSSAPLDIKNLSNYYIAGQTAPSPVTVTGRTTRITASNNRTNSNVILRYMAFRGSDDGNDAITFKDGDTSAPSTNMIMDHVSASWAEDEDLSVANANTNVTVQYSIIADALTSDHAYGSLIRPEVDSNVSFHHNLYANNLSRQARFGTYNGKTLIADFRNNVIYNWKSRASYAGGSGVNDPQEQAHINYVGNYLVAGPHLQAGASATQVFGVDTNVDVQLYQASNFIDSDRQLNPAGVPDGSLAPQSAFVLSSNQDQTLSFLGTPFPTAVVTTQSAPSAFAQVLNYVGNSWAARDPIDERIINNVKTNTGPPNGVAAAAPNAAELASVMSAPLITRPAGWDTDNDGMPDAWELAHGLNPNSAADNKLDFDNDGYINIIEYVNEAGEFPAPAPIVFTNLAIARYADITNWRTSDGITAGSNWQPSKYDTAIINSKYVIVDAVGQHAGTLRVTSSNGDAGALSMNSGRLDVAQTLEVAQNLGAAGNATVFHNGGTLIAENIVLGAENSRSGVYNLLGSGVLVVNVLSKNAESGAFNMEGGTLTAQTVAFSLTNNGGTIAPGASLGLMNVSGDLTNASGTLRMEFAGTAAGQYDKIAVTGALVAGGVLDIDLLGGFTPAAGNSFDLFDFASASGAFTLALPALPVGLNWNASNLLTTGVLSVTSALTPNADFNGDNMVDGADFVLWQRGLGLTSQSTNANGDADRNGTINAADLAIWRSQIGTNPNLAPVSAPVPEPSSVILFAIGGALIARRGWVAKIAG